jgi:hypothetical protein
MAQRRVRALLAICLLAALALLFLPSVGPSEATAAQQEKKGAEGCVATAKGPITAQAGAAPAAAVAIAVYGDTTISVDFWVQDCSAATENMLVALAAQRGKKNAAKRTADRIGAIHLLECRLHYGDEDWGRCGMHPGLVNAVYSHGAGFISKPGSEISEPGNPTEPDDGSNSLRSWTRSQRIRTFAEMALETALWETAEPQKYQQIAERALRLSQLGFSNEAIARHIDVDGKTVAKALRWMLEGT